MSRAFFDTNIVLYALDKRDQSASCRTIARELLATHGQNDSVILSTQVLQETYDNAIRKFKLPAHLVGDYVADLAKFEVVGSDSTLVLEAIALSQRFQFRIFDALMLAAAVRAGCQIFYTEDLSHGQIISGVRIVNPFKSPESA